MDPKDNMKLFIALQILPMLILDYHMIFEDYYRDDNTFLVYTNLVFTFVQLTAAILLLIFSRLLRRYLVDYFFMVICMILFSTACIILNDDENFSPPATSMYMYQCWILSHYFVFVCFNLVRHIKSSIEKHETTR